MGVAAAAAVIGALAGLASLIGGGVSRSKQEKAQKKQVDWQNEQQAKSEKAQRRAALAKAIGAIDLYAPKPRGPMPGPANTAGWDFLAGAGQYAGNLAAMKQAQLQNQPKSMNQGMGGQ
jgi:hypothetical protein